jgi:hypothetical protein
MNKKTSRNLIILSVGLALILILIIILFSRETNTYTGFLKPGQGAWSETIFIDQDNVESLRKSIYLGEKIIDNIPAYGTEMELIASNDKSAITQVWLDKKSNETVKIVSKLNGKDEVICISDSLMEVLIPSFRSSVDFLFPTVKTPVKYGSDNINNKYTYGTFTTETGKTIQIAKFVDENNMEIWISSEVPFGIVKVADTKSNKIIFYLRDFGLTEAKPKISETEMINCKKIGLPTF